MKDNININVRLAGQFVTPLRGIPLDDEIIYRQAEAYVNRLWDEWQRRYPGKSKLEVMALVAFQCAHQHFFEERERQQAANTLADADRALDLMLKATEQWLSMPASEEEEQHNPAATPQQQDTSAI